MNRTELPKLQNCSKGDFNLGSLDWDSWELSEYDCSALLVGHVTE